MHRIALVDSIVVGDFKTAIIGEYYEQENIDE